MRKPYGTILQVAKEIDQLQCWVVAFTPDAHLVCSMEMFLECLNPRDELNHFYLDRQVLLDCCDDVRPL